MATWHQMKARRRAGKSFTLQHATEWRVLHDPCGQMASIMTFNSEFAANCYRDRMLARGETSHYVLPPLWIARARKALAEQGDVYC